MCKIKRQFPTTFPLLKQVKAESNAFPLSSDELLAFIKKSLEDFHSPKEQECKMKEMGIETYITNRY